MCQGFRKGCRHFCRSKLCGHKCHIRGTRHADGMHRLHTHACHMPHTTHAATTAPNRAQLHALASTAFHRSHAVSPKRACALRSASERATSSSASASSSAACVHVGACTCVSASVRCTRTLQCNKSCVCVCRPFLRGRPPQAASSAPPAVHAFVYTHIDTSTRGWTSSRRCSASSSTARRSFSCTHATYAHTHARTHARTQTQAHTSAYDTCASACVLPVFL